MNRDPYLHRGILASLSALVLLIAAAAHGADSKAARPAAGAARSVGHMEAPLAFGEVIDVNLRVGPKEKPGVLTLAWVVFETNADGIRAVLRGALVSRPRGKWQVAVHLLDQKGKSVATQSVVVENSGMALGVAVVHEGDLSFSFKRGPELAGATRFRVEVSTAGERAPTTGKLIRPDRRRRRPKGEFSLAATISGSRIRPGELGECTLWRLVKPSKPSKPADPVEGLSVLHGGWSAGWYDPLTKQTWQPYGCSPFGSKKRRARMTYDGLAAGTYRVTVVNSWKGDPSPAGASQPVSLSDASPAGKGAINLKGEHALLITLVGAGTGQPLPATRLILRRADGMPLVANASSRGLRTDEKGTKSFRHLEPGSYTVHAGLHEDVRRWEVCPSSSPVVVEVEIGARETTEIIISLTEPPK
ncbi:MAG: hypothetical protein HN380_20850 [Victivallales bacterium]|nr:hypothetical protein [Victivallales bacterium]